MVGWYVVETFEKKVSPGIHLLPYAYHILKGQVTKKKQRFIFLRNFIKQISKELSLNSWKSKSPYLDAYKMHPMIIYLFLGLQISVNSDASSRAW